MQALRAKRLDYRLTPDRTRRQTKIFHFLTFEISTWRRYSNSRAFDSADEGQQNFEMEPWLLLSRRVIEMVPVTSTSYPVM